MPHRIGLLEKRVTLAEREAALERIPLIRMIVREIEERLQRWLLSEASRAILGDSPAGVSARAMHDGDIALELRELRRAKRELRRLGCCLVTFAPLTIQLKAPSGSRMLWILEPD
jgi:hypothetical protein